MKKVKALCSGCKNDYYNHNREGGCWSCHSPGLSVWIDRNDVRIK
jgi:Zn finger protein HypA/HybF involved in hydrogenase expression